MHNPRFSSYIYLSDIGKRALTGKKKIKPAPRLSHNPINPSHPEWVDQALIQPYPNSVKEPNFKKLVIPTKSNTINNVELTTIFLIALE
jgi:hypothetical protein